MAETEKKVRKTGGAKPTKRDGYDEFLEETEKKTAPKGTRRSSDSSKKKTASEAGKATGTRSSSAKSKTDAVPSHAKSADRAPAAKKAASVAKSDKPVAKPAAARTKSADKPIAKPAAAKVKADKPEAKQAVAKVKNTAKADKPAAKTSAKAKNAGKSGSTAKSGATGRHAPRSKAAVLYVSNDGRDAFDDFLEETARPVPKKKHKKKRKKRADGLTALLILGILGVVGLGAWQTTEYQTFRIMKAAVATETFYEGTTVEGVNVSGMTLAQAMEYWESSVEPAYAQRAVAFENGLSITAKDLGYSSDYASVLSNAWAGGRSGTLEERYEAISNRSRLPVSYNVSRVPYTQEAIGNCVSAIASQVDKPAQDAKIGAFDVETYAFTFKDEVVGSRLDQAALKRDIAAALDAGGGAVVLKVDEVQPTLRKDDIASQYGMITYAVTNASSSSKNRLTNIKLALSSINGYCLEPGATFSFNDVVGKRTKDRGYKIATAYSGGEVTEDVGGGICQVSTTLFNAAVKADLEIVERHNHSLTVGYVDLGKDASVSWNSQDLRFTNNGEDSVYIVALLTEDKRVRIGVFGKLLPNGETITLEGRVTETIEFETIYQPSLAIAPGVTEVTQEGRKGYKADAYKMRWDADGNRISRELLCRSTYKVIDQIVEYGP